MTISWTGFEGTAGEAAAHRLITSLRHLLTRADGVHAETLLAAGGAVAGFAAQRTLMATLAEQRDRAALEALHIVVTGRGDKFLCGAPLDDTLTARQYRDGAPKLLSHAAALAMAAGADGTALPQPAAVFESVARRLGTDEEGWPSVPARHRPHLPVSAILDFVWPLASSVFNGRLPGHDRDTGAVPHRDRPVVGAIVAAIYIAEVIDRVDPATAFTIVAESAVYASRLDAGRVSVAIP